MSSKQHWEQLYRSHHETTLSWHQPEPVLSWQLIAGLALPRDAAIIDVGGGTSRLVDALLAAGYERPAVLDISAQALSLAQARLGRHAPRVEWLEADVTTFEPSRPFDVWHDRALFHFFVDTEARARYVQALRRALRPGGHVIIATFAPEGPTHCSGLAVARYDASRLHTVLGPDFQLRQAVAEAHRTPSGVEQGFAYFVWQHCPPAPAPA